MRISHDSFGLGRALLLAALAVWVRAEVGRADVFVLKTGARIEGEWLNAGEAPLRKYLVRWRDGTQLTIDVAQVTEHRIEAKGIDEYERRAPATPDQVQAQWDLSEWCRAQGLKHQRQQHLWRVIELEPDHAAARQALGFSLIDGRWVTRQGHFESRGYVYYRGKWRLPQEVDRLEERRDVDRREREWFGRIKTWRGQLGTEHESAALNQLQGIEDPLALRALKENLRKERLRSVRILYVQAIGKIPSPAAIECLTQTALDDADPEIFYECVDVLVEQPIPNLSKALTEYLKDAKNVRVNRAAYMLGRLGDRKAIPALTAALVTTHQVPVASSGRTQATFVQPTGPVLPSALAPAAGGGLGDNAMFSAGKSKTSVPVQVANQQVLAALVELSGGQSFGFDQRAWSHWWASVSGP